MKKKKVNWKVTCTAIVGIVVLDSVALLCGHNGVLLLTSISLIAGIAGYKLKDK